MRLITETTHEIITESIGKDLYITGVFSSANIRNKNGRVYEKTLLEREINKLSSNVSGSSLYGQLNHPERPEIDLEKVAILIKELSWNGNDVIGKAKVLEKTYCGGILRGIIDGGGKVGISSRGLGTVSEDGNVNEDFNLICWDIVSDASNHASKYVNGIYEGKEFGSIVKNNTIDMKDAQEKAFKHIWQVLKNIEKEL